VLDLGRQFQPLDFAGALRRSALVARQVDNVAVVARCASRFSLSMLSTR